MDLKTYSRNLLSCTLGDLLFKGVFSGVAGPWDIPRYFISSIVISLFPSRSLVFVTNEIQAVAWICFGEYCSKSCHGIILLAGYTLHDSMLNEDFREVLI